MTLGGLRAWDDWGAEQVQLDQLQLAIIGNWAREVRWIAEVRVFGSRARDGAGPSSDVDIAITLEGEDADTAFVFGEQKWERELGERLGLRVDIEPWPPAHLRRHDAKMEEVLREAILIWSRQ